METSGPTYGRAEYLRAVERGEDPRWSGSTGWACRSRGWVEWVFKVKGEVLTSAQCEARGIHWQARGVAIGQAITALGVKVLAAGRLGRRS